MPSKISRFLYELKRRNVIRVLAVYIAAAFMILELISMTSEPFGLPEGTLKVTFIISLAGLVIAFIVSWIFDIHPEGGIVKTEPVEKVSEESVLPSSKGWKIASYISFVVIVALIVLNIIPRTGNKKVIDKSIAVLPFRNESSDDDNTYFINGVMESILDNLSRIEDLRVISRNSVEKYRDDPKLTPVVAEEMDVGYVLEGSGQKVGNRLLLSLQLIAGDDDRHIWSKQYDREIEKVEELIDIQKEVAQLVVEEIEAIITPAEKLLIEKIPTTNLTALDFYQRGRDEYFQYLSDYNNRKALESAENNYYKALDYDSTFALAYTGLAYVYWNKHYWESFFSESFLDSVLILADNALSFDPQLSDAYAVRGHYYRANGQIEQTIREFDKAIKLNPNDWMAHYGRGYSYRSIYDYVKAIEDFHMVASLYRGPLLSSLFRELGNAYLQSGFLEESRSYAYQAFMLDGDTISYYNEMFWIEYYSGNGHERSLESIYLMDTTRNDILQQLAEQFGFDGKFEESLMYFKKYFKRLDASGAYSLGSMHRLGYAYWKNGFYEEADSCIDTMIEYYKDLNNVGRSINVAKYDLACVYAFRGEKGKAYESLKFFDHLDRIPLWWITLLRTDPFFESIRDEPEFQQILSDVEAKYQAEHERVRKWLEENDML